ncbi:MAG TPA: hypothetical protein VHY37_05025 [Tepidisphaeraceae bacterium]|jgi:hypothetical protein|nr:hypothetical protein [Tepidisphaeraceae bacterium]
MRQGWLLCGVLFLMAAGGCQPAGHSRTPGEEAMFGPAYMRIHPTFTHLTAGSEESGVHGVDAVIEFQDQFGEPTRSSGTVIFELYRYRPSDPNPLGVRIAHWEASLDTKDEQLSHWNPAVRGYSFTLEYDKIDADNSYVLTAQVNRGGGSGSGRFFSKLVLETTHEGKHSGRPTPHASLESPGH